MTIYRTYAVALIALAFNGSANASDEGTLQYTDEMYACIAEINNHADYSDATRVRHVIVGEKRTSIGYVIAIDTTVLNVDPVALGPGVVVREYKTHCVAKGEAKPVKFRMNEVNT